MREKESVWFDIINHLDVEAYLREMAAGGLILEDVNHLAYIFRKGEPENNFYRIEKRERCLSEEERETLAAEGWQEVCHYELHYVYCKKGMAKDTEGLEPKIIQKELERATYQWEEYRRSGIKMGWIILIAAILFALGEKLC